MFSIALDPAAGRPKGDSFFPGECCQGEVAFEKRPKELIAGESARSICFGKAVERARLGISQRSTHLLLRLMSESEGFDN
jgi:hypothetical protein